MPKKIFYTKILPKQRLISMMCVWILIRKRINGISKKRKISLIHNLVQIQSAGGGGNAGFGAVFGF